MYTPPYITLMASNTCHKGDFSHARVSNDKANENQFGGWTRHGELLQRREFVGIKTANV